MRVPQSMPQVSRFARVFGAAILRNCSRRFGGRKTVRNGSPFSRYAEGRNVNAGGSAATGDGVDEELCSSYIGCLSGLGGTVPSYKSCS
jgi:hypothetical protein